MGHEMICYCWDAPLLWWRPWALDAGTVVGALVRIPSYPIDALDALNEIARRSSIPDTSTREG
jgi:hypothetical protein